MGSYLHIQDFLRVFRLHTYISIVQRASGENDPSIDEMLAKKERKFSKKKKKGRRRSSETTEEIEVCASRNAWRDVSSRSDR